MRGVRRGRSTGIADVTANASATARPAAAATPANHSGGGASQSATDCNGLGSPNARSAIQPPAQLAANATVTFPGDHVDYPSRRASPARAGGVGAAAAGLTA